MKTLFYFLLVTIVISSCKKHINDVVETENVHNTTPAYCNNCPTSYDLRSQLYVSIYKGRTSRGCFFEESFIYLDNYTYFTPVINPNNSYEIIYLQVNEKITSKPVQKLYKYNFCTNTRTFLTDNVFFAHSWNYSLDWSCKDWILFTGKDHKLYKIKSNGDSLTLLVNEGGTGAKWNKDGTKFVYRSVNYTFKICSANGTQLHETTTWMNAWDWKNNDELLFVANINATVLGLQLYNIITNTTMLIAPTSNGIASTNLEYDGKDYVYFDGDTGLVRVNINTGVMNIVVNAYGNVHSYAGQTVTNRSVNILNSTKLIYSKALQDTFTNGGICKINYRSHIAISNIDGTNERQVLLPE